MRPCSTSSPADTRELIGTAQRSPYREHDFDRDVGLARDREHAIAGAGIQWVEAHHHHVPAVVVHRLLQHRVAGIGTETLGERQEANRPFVAQPFQLRDELGHARGVFGVAHTVKVVHVDPIGAQFLQ